MQTTEIITTDKWNIDPVHSTIGFKVKHLMVSIVRGEFKEYTASIYTKGEDFLSIEIDLRIDPASIRTGDAARDAHLKGAEFFNVEFFKEINFRATGLEETGVEMYVLHGDLTMKGITRTIRLDVELDGVTKSPGGDKRAYFIVTGNINRKDWGLTWSAMMESGGVVVGENIFIRCEIELIKQPGKSL
jgi:polyisoprenoid-binding protein YceI